MQKLPFDRPRLIHMHVYHILVYHLLYQILVYSTLAGTESLWQLGTKAKAEA